MLLINSMIKTVLLNTGTTEQTILPPLVYGAKGR
jgi:hypothetical protein